MLSLEYDNVFCVIAGNTVQFTNVSRSKKLNILKLFLNHRLGEVDGTRCSLWYDPSFRLSVQGGIRSNLSYY